MTRMSLTDRETEIVALVSSAFPGMNLQAVTLEQPLAGGGHRPVLRITLNDAYSSDVTRESVASDEESSEELAQRVEEDLRAQMPGA
jgi:hypothetical protein